MVIITLILILIVMLFSISAQSAHAEIKVIDKPLWIFPGQRFRIALEQPSGSGQLDVDVPDSLEMFDQWPKDSIQRFYFRAVEAGDATLRFHGAAGDLDIPLEVIPWSDIFKPREFADIDLPRIWPLDDLGYRELKTTRTCYTEEELSAKRASGAKPDKQAEEWISMNDEDIYNIVPGSDVPRTCLIVLGGYEDPIGKGCPVCGMDIYEGRSGFYPWKFDPVGHPWKVGCPSCGTWFPSNDWASGDMHSGDFPDDGYGCEPVNPVLSPSGKPWRWPFIAYYHEWAAYMRGLTPGIERCAEAFARTGDKTYAHKTAVGLFRLAESLLDMSLNLNHRKMPVRNGVYMLPVGAPDPRAIKRLSHSFLYIQPNWDTPRFEACARAWDIIFDQLDGDDELLKFCQKRYHHEIRTVEDFRHFIESGFRVVAQACLDDAVSRNYPMQETALATMALTLNTPRSLELIDWLLNEGGQLRFGLTNEYFKDGAGHESEGYNGIQIRDMNRLLKILDRVRSLNSDLYKPPRFLSLLDDPKYRQMYEFPINDSLIGRIYPGAGDTGQPLTAAPWPPNQTFPMRSRDYVDVYRATRDPRFAQAIYGPDGKIPAELKEPELRAEVERIGRERGWQVSLESNILDGFGHAILRSGEGDRQRALWVRYGRSVQHAHPDMLTMGFEALKRRMLPELGYPQGWTHASSWESNWGTHYGTHITGISTSSFPRGRLTLFADSPPVRVATAEVILRSKGGVRAFRSRTVVLVDISDDDCYALSLERVRGGEEHRWSFHGPDGEVTASGVQLTPRGGTALGEDVPYGDTSELPAGDGELSCLASMYDPQTAQPKDIWALDYLLRHQGDVHLRMTMLEPDDADLTVAKGKAPGGKSDYQMTWAIHRRQGAEPLSSQYLCVLEPYENECIIQKIERIAVTADSEGDFPPLAVRVTTDEYVDTIVLQNGANSVCKTNGLVCDGEFSFWRERNGEPVAVVLAHGSILRKGETEIRQPDAAYTGVIESCDFANFEVKIAPAPHDIPALAGKHLHIHNDAGNAASYLIKEARPAEGGCVLNLALDPRIGEGFVGGFEDGCLISRTHLRLARFSYYAGKTLANEDHSALFRLSDVENGVRCRIHEAAHGQATADVLSAQFNDRDGDGLSRFIIYDYGPGDAVTIKNVAAFAN
jgi:hypothetical protein